MEAPLVRRLRTDIATTTDPVRRGISQAELACYLARIGNFEEAEALRIELRHKFGDARSPTVSILIMCVESLILYYQELSPKARDWMMRAQLISKSLKEKKVLALTSAWLAHIDFNQNRFDSMPSSLRLCFESIDADDGSADCRISLVLGDAFLFAGKSEISQRWYERARQAAVNNGDQAAVGALIYNRAILRMGRARFEFLTVSPSEDQIRMLRTEMQSAVNYQFAAGVKSLDYLLQTGQVGVLMLTKSYADAVIQIRGILSLPEISKTADQTLLLNADLMLALALSDQKVDSVAWLDVAEKTGHSVIAADDRSLVWAAAFEIARLAGKSELAVRFLNLMKDSIAEHQKVVEHLSQIIKEFECVAA